MTTWKTSSYSGTGDEQGGGNCVQVAELCDGQDWFANA
ncbi:DUF397 domain-containing protein [Actinoallomurus bryophytorum]|nr:DUF397 domain-containing protein [Actinoallomurus bryophytorum]